MSSTNRQNRLLLAEDWKKVYQSFRNAEFKSYDFDNLRRTMINYIRQNYPEDFNDYLYAHYDDEAVQHLFSVTCGLDSAVVGENEVQHQVKVAWERAREEGTCGTVINEVFRRALEAVSYTHLTLPTTPYV